MKFQTPKNTNDFDTAYDALLFLRKAIEQKTIYEIENIDDVFDLLSYSLEIKDSDDRFANYNL